MGKEVKFSTINGWTKEKMKERVRERVLERSLSEGGISCLYRSFTKDGRDNCCAAGAFIEDKRYHESMESQSIKTLMEQDPRLAASLPLNQDGMTELQAMHDRSTVYSSAGEAMVVVPDHEVPEALCRWIDANVVDT